MGTISHALLALTGTSVLSLVRTATVWADEGHEHAEAAPGSPVSLIFLISLLAGPSRVPIYLIREEWRVVSLKAWFVGLTSKGTMAKLTLTQALEAVGLGLVVNFVNVLFVTRYGASTVFVGNLFAFSTVAVALCTLFTPALVKRLGQVRTLVGIQLAGLPFLLLMVVSPHRWLAGAGYLLREVFTGIGAGPTGGMGSPIERLFPMEIVQQHERGTTNGLMHAFLEFPMSIGAAIAGPMMVRGEWSQIYLLAAAWFAASSLTFLCFFLPVETRMRLTASAGRVPASRG